MATPARDYNDARIPASLRWLGRLRAWLWVFVLAIVVGVLIEAFHGRFGGLGFLLSMILAGGLRVWMERRDAERERGAKDRRAQREARRSSSGVPRSRTS